MIKVITAALALLLISGAIFWGSKSLSPERTTEGPPEVPPPVLVVAVSVYDGDFESDETLAIGGGDSGGYALVTLNEDPIAVHTFGGSLHPIGPWVVKGTNTIKLTGDFDEPLYVKVAWQGRDGSIDVIGKRKFDPQALEGSHVTFEIESDHGLPMRERLPEDDEKLNAMGQEVRQIAMQIEDLIRSGKGREAADLLLRGQHVWMRKVHRADAKALEHGMRQTSDLLSGNEFHLVPEDKDRDFNIIAGERCILLYRANMQWGESPSAFRLTNKAGEVRSIPPLRFVRIDGNWVIW